MQFPQTDQDDANKQYAAQVKEWLNIKASLPTPGWLCTRIHRDAKPIAERKKSATAGL